MKILSITNDIDSGGAARSLFVLVRNLAAMGHELAVITICQPVRTTDRIKELQTYGVQVQFVPIPHYPMRYVACPMRFCRNIYLALANRGEFSRLRRMVEAFDADIIHYNSYTALFASLVLKRYPGVLHAREVLVESSPLLLPTKALVRSRIRGIVAISPVEAEQTKRVFRLPVSIVLNTPLHAPRLTPMPTTPGLTYSVFSHVSPAKGHLVCIRAVAMVADKLRKAGVRIRLYGGKIAMHAGLYDFLTHEIAALGMGDLVSFEGFCENPETQMENMHLLLRPDLTGHPWGRDVLEAMSLGRAVLATGSRETFVKPGNTGMLVPPGDAKALAKVMLQMADRHKLETLGRNAYEFARENFDPDINAAKFADILELYRTGQYLGDTF